MTYFNFAHRRIRRRGSRLRAPMIGKLHFDRLISFANLKANFDDLRANGGGAPGVDGVTFADLGRSELAEALRCQTKVLASGEYEPAPHRAIKIPKSSGNGTRELHIQNVIDRVVAKTLYNAVHPFFERQFFDRSFGFRPKRSALDMLAHLAVAAHKHGQYFVAIDDIKDAFDNVVVAPVLKSFEEILGQGPLFNLLTVVLRGGEADREFGIDQGSALSPLALNVCLHEAHDAHLMRVAPAGWFRYADNVAYQADSAAKAKRLRDDAADTLHRYGLTLKGVDSDPVDLRRGRVHVLGFALSLRNSQIRLGLTEGPWSKLRKELQEAHESDDPPRKARSVLSGWVHHYGCALVYEGESAVRRLLNAAHDCGFHDVVHVDAIAQWIMESHDRWDELVAALEGVAMDSVDAEVGDDDEGIVGVQAGAPLRHVFRPVTRTTPVRKVAPLVRSG